MNTTYTHFKEEPEVLKTRLLAADIYLKMVVENKIPTDEEEIEDLAFHLRDYFNFVGSYGVTVFKWEKIKPSLKYMIEYTSNDVWKRNIAKCKTAKEKAALPKEETINELKEHILERIESFDEAPFTIQRLGEIIYNYDTFNLVVPYLNGIVKVVSVITTQTPKGVRITGEPEEDIVKDVFVPPTPRLNLKVDELDDDIITRRPILTSNIESCFITSETTVVENGDKISSDTEEKK
uniref:Uncharacterized protein n=1 Tax=Parastrongyloides trichosuri TaxID=131310 RepID=A0A0N4Z3M1_PARTI